MARDEEYLTGVIIYENKETKSSQHMQIEFFYGGTHNSCEREEYAIMALNNFPRI